MAARKPKAGTYTDGVNPTGYPASEHLEPVTESHGFEVGDIIEFVNDFADDVPAGRRGKVENVDNHPTMPITVFVHYKEGGFFFTPVKPDEIRKVEPEAPAEAVSAEGAEGDAEPEAVAA